MQNRKFFLSIFTIHTLCFAELKNFTPPRQPHLTGTTQVGSFALHPASLFQDTPICHLCPFEAPTSQPDSQNEQRDCASHHPGYVLFLPPSWAGTSSDSPPTFYPAIPEPTMYTHPGTTPFQSSTSPVPIQSCFSYMENHIWHCCRLSQWRVSIQERRMTAVLQHGICRGRPILRLTRAWTDTRQPAQSYITISTLLYQGWL